MATTPLNLTRMTATSARVDSIQIAEIPPLPQRFLDRYPEMIDWQNKMRQWRLSFISELNNKLSQQKPSTSGQGM